MSHVDKLNQMTPSERLIYFEKIKGTYVWGGTTIGIIDMMPTGDYPVICEIDCQQKQYALWRAEEIVTEGKKVYTHKHLQS